MTTDPLRDTPFVSALNPAATMRLLRQRGVPDEQLVDAACSAASRFRLHAGFFIFLIATMIFVAFREGSIKAALVFSPMIIGLSWATEVRFRLAGLALDSIARDPSPEFLLREGTWRLVVGEYPPSVLADLRARRLPADAVERLPARAARRDKLMSLVLCANALLCVMLYVASWGAADAHAVADLFGAIGAACGFWAGRRWLTARRIEKLAFGEPPLGTAEPCYVFGYGRKRTALVLAADTLRITIGTNPSRSIPLASITSFTLVTVGSPDGVIAKTCLKIQSEGAQDPERIPINPDDMSFSLFMDALCLRCPDAARHGWLLVPGQSAGAR